MKNLINTMINFLRLLCIKRKKSSITLIIFLCCITNAQFALAGISVNVSPSSIQWGDTFRLTLTLDAIQNHSVPDLTPLLKNFDVIGTERNISYTVINGQARSISQWSVILKPKKQGTIIIPPIQVGQEQSTQSQIVVKKELKRQNNIQSNDSQDNSLFLASVNNTTPFINQQIIYTVRLLTQQRLLDAQYHPPQVEDALMIPVGDGRHYQTQFKEQLYEVEEQKYAVFPHKSGKLLISPPALDAMAFGDFGPSRIRLEAKPLKLNVAPIPADQSIKNWLPARAITLEESYENTSKHFLEGDTLVRTITLKAKDLAAQLLPPITFNNTTSYHVYQEKPTTENLSDHGDLWGSARIQITYLFSQSGQIVLPSIHIPWFNTVTHHQEIATLPERILTVKARPGSRQTSSPPTLSAKNTASASIPPKIIKQDNIISIFWILVGLISLGSLGFLFWRQHQRHHASKTIQPDKMIPLKKACKANDPHQARTALIRWAAMQWPNCSILNLSDIPLDDPTFKAELERLSQALYASQQQNAAWTGDKLWHCINMLKTTRPTKKKNKLKLPPMNPI